MQKTFNTQPNLYISPSDLEHPILHSLDDTEALLDGSKHFSHPSTPLPLAGLATRRLLIKADPSRFKAVKNNFSVGKMADPLVFEK